jgi:hypothetical protein
LSFYAKQTGRFRTYSSHWGEYLTLKYQSMIIKQLSHSDMFSFLDFQRFALIYFFVDQLCLDLKSWFGTKSFSAQLAIERIKTVLKERQDEFRYMLLLNQDCLI